MPQAPLASRKAILVKGALSAYLRPKLLPGTVLALDAALGSVNRLNWKTEKQRVLATVAAIATPVLAKDAKIDDLAKAVDWMDDEEDGEAEDDMIEEDTSEEEEESEEERKRRMAMEKKARDKKAADAKRAKDRKAKDATEEEEEREKDAGSGSESEEEKEARMARAKDRKARDEKKAMDSAIETATAGVLARMNAAIEAREAVRPIVGNVSLALDSAEAIYKHALDAHKVPLNGVHPSAYRAMVGMLPRPGQAKAPLALDSAAADDAFAMFPGLARIRLS